MNEFIYLCTYLFIFIHLFIYLLLSSVPWRSYTGWRKEEMKEERKIVNHLLHSSQRNILYSSL